MSSRRHAGRSSRCSQMCCKQVKPKLETSKGHRTSKRPRSTRPDAFVLRQSHSPPSVEITKRPPYYSHSARQLSASSTPRAGKVKATLRQHRSSILAPSRRLPETTSPTARSPREACLSQLMCSNWAGRVSLFAIARAWLCRPCGFREFRN